MKRKERKLAIRIRTPTLANPRPEPKDPAHSGAVRGVKLKEGKELRPGMAGSAMRYHKVF